MDSIVAAGLEILAAEGADAVTMRAVAGKLGTGAASLYAHVRDKGELHALLLDAVIGEVDVPEADPARWREQIKQFCWGQYRAMVRHPGIAAVSLAHIPTGPNALRCSEGMLAILTAGGLSKLVAGLAVDLLTQYTTAVAYEDTLWWVRAEDGNDPFASEGSVVAQAKAYFAGLPPAEYPMITSMVEELTTGDGDARFQFGLDMIVAGLDNLRDWRLPG
ncbi:TetR family transcriptional regulator ActII [Microlunatus ginsengisoli]|uniref:TetR family transcriptional regulator ActII n=1 Tax=Microlunatus ginsengisoli TaxID=363863 RepID=A0ABP7A7J2_9ACTN